jgi:hypothetical protein
MASRARTATEEDQRSAGSPLALLAAPTAGTPDKPSASAKHALTRGMRLHGNEAQVTQAVAALAQSDPRFAREFVRLVLKVARTDGRHAANVKLMGDPPADMSCQAEHSVYDEYDYGLGRVDLRFDGGDDFTLFAENKLHSGFGLQQLQRYQAALRVLPDERTRSGLVAITSDVPSHGELDAGADGWLGAVRWARLYDEGLRDLLIADIDVRTQWRLLIDVLHDQGDLGLTTVDSDLIRAWSRYEDGQAHLAALLNGIRQRALDLVRDALQPKRYSGAGGRETVADLHFFGMREAVPVKREKSAVWTGFRVPAAVDRPTVRLSFWSDGDPAFSVDVLPWKAAERLEDGERQLLTAAGKLAKAGFQSETWKGEHVWWREYRAKDFIESDDVSARLLQLIEKDVGAIADSGMLAYDFKAATTGGRGGPPKVKRSKKKGR